MKAAIRGQVWKEAALFADEVLAKYPDDAEIHALVAEVAHHNEQPERAAELLVEACRKESFASEKRLQQATIALVGVGRLHDAMDLLDEALVNHPNQLETRRWLYDFCMGTENRPRGLVHGRILVRKRSFDLEFLLTLSNTERRTQDAKPLESMTTRNPDDIRPLVGDARIKFDESSFDECIRITRQILARHPTFLPAQLLLGRSLAAAERLSEIESWARGQSPGIEAYADYWMTLGDWARAKKHSHEAVRAYWEATRRDPDALEPWSKLSAAIKLVDHTHQNSPNDVLNDIDLRVARLSSLNQAKSRFERTGKISRAISLQIVESLRDLGRLWEAEAWASIAMSLPEDDSVPLAETRTAIVSRLGSDTPWQITAGFPELEMDLSEFEMPEIALGASPEKIAVTAKIDTLDRPAITDSGLSFNDEAQARGVNFFGRTSDHLDQPGIMLYETLGCGGGAIDFDLDGWSDLYLVAAGGTPPERDSEPNALLRNQAGFFGDVTKFTGTGDTGFGQGVCVGDVNEDGFPDLLVLNYGPNALLINNGDGSFADASDRLTPAQGSGSDTAWSTSAAIADIDGDSIADIVIVHYCAGLEPVTETCPMADTTVFRSCTPVKFPALADQFIQGQPDGTFVDRTDDWNAIPQTPGRGLGIVVGSLDHASGNDVFVANDMTNNHYWSRQTDTADFKLTDSAMPRGLAADDRLQPQGSMGIAAADLDGDSDVDLYVTNFDREYNTYHDQVHEGIWQDRTSQLKLTSPTMPLVGFGTQAVDMDHDASLELIVTNGHVDLFSRGEERVEYAQPMQVFRRRANSTFESIEDSIQSEYLRGRHVGRSLWMLDVNRDGRTDLVVTHQTQPVAILVNDCQSRGNWLELELRGTRCSRDAIGAIVTVRSGDATWTQPLTCGDGYLCSNERLLRFGLGNSVETLTIQVHWPDGSEQDVEGIDINGRWLITQDSTIFVAI